MIIYLFLFILGSCIGSFLNVCADRWSNEKSIKGRSKCDYCEKILAWYDLIPYLSYISLYGKCRYCKHKLSSSYLFAELLTGLAFMVSFVIYNNLGKTIYDYVIMLPILSSLIIIIISDIKYRIIPDEATITIIIFSFLVNILKTTGLTDMFFTYFIPALVLFGGLLLLYLLTRGRGMGFGDVKFAFAMGFLLGLKSGFIALYIGFILGGLASVFLLFGMKKGLKSKIAFGPFLALGTLIMLFYPQPILEIVQKYFGI